MVVSPWQESVFLCFFDRALPNSLHSGVRSPLGLVKESFLVDWDGN